MQAEILELAKYRLNKAEECLSDSQDAYEEDRLANSINRSYYAMFHATRALLALNSFDSKRRSTIIGYFNQNYIATDKIDVTYYQILSNAFRVRNKTDYDDFYVVGRDEARQQLGQCSKFYNNSKVEDSSCHNIASIVVAMSGSKILMPSKSMKPGILAVNS